MIPAVSKYRFWKNKYLKYYVKELEKTEMCRYNHILIIYDNSWGIFPTSEKQNYFFSHEILKEPVMKFSLL